MKNSVQPEGAARKRLPRAILRPVLLALALALPPQAPTRAEVYRALAPAGFKALSETGGPWRQIYAAPMTVNGERADLTVSGCSEPLPAVLARLRKCFANPESILCIGNGNSAWMFAEGEKTVYRLLALFLPSVDRTVLFSLEQSRASFMKPEPAEARGVFPEYGFLPGSRLEMSARNGATGAALESRITAQPPAQALAEAAAVLSGRGWRPALPEDETGRAESLFQIFHRGGALCLVTAGNALNGKETCVTILIKEKSAP